MTFSWNRQNCPVVPPEHTYTQTCRQGTQAWQQHSAKPRLCFLVVISSSASSVPGRVTKHITENSSLKSSFSGCSGASFSSSARTELPAAAPLAPGLPVSASPELSPGPALQGPSPHGHCPATDSPPQGHRHSLPTLFGLRVPLVSPAALLQWQPPLSSALLCSPTPHSALPHTFPRPVAAFRGTLVITVWYCLMLNGTLNASNGNIKQKTMIPKVFSDLDDCGTVSSLRQQVWSKLPGFQEEPSRRRRPTAAVERVEFWNVP